MRKRLHFLPEIGLVFDRQIINKKEREKNSMSIIEKMEKEVVAELKEMTKEPIQSRIIEKSNGLKLHGVGIGVNESKSISAIVYLEVFLPAYQKGESVSDIAKEMIRIAEQLKEWGRTRPDIDK